MRGMVRGTKLGRACLAPDFDAHQPAVRRCTAGRQWAPARPAGPHFASVSGTRAADNMPKTKGCCVNKALISFSIGIWVFNSVDSRAY